MTQKVHVLQLGDEVLRKKAAVVEEAGSAEVAKTITQMLDVLAESKGVGLAAPQIGHSICVIVIASKPTSRYPNAPLMSPVVMINPTFQPLSDERENGWEGCLSIPGIRGLVPRYKNIRANYTGGDGKQATIDLNGFAARIFQHEHDHLQGLVYLDRLENNRNIISETEFFKLLVA